MSRGVSCPSRAATTISPICWTAIVAISDSEPELGLLRRRRAEAHLRRGQSLELLVDAALDSGAEAEARRRAADAAVAVESLVEVQRDRLARREQTAENEDAMLAYGLEHAAAMRAVAEGRGESAPGSSPRGGEP